jgi:hypothetical protein
LPRALAASALALVLPLAACAGTDADADPAASGSSASGSSTSPAPGTSTAAPEGTGDATPAPAGRRIEVQVAGGQVSGDIGRVPVAVGEEITLVLTSDVADEAHVHGYDLSADLQPGTPAELTFPATIPGVFEVELHEAGTVLLTLQVS